MPQDANSNLEAILEELKQTQLACNMATEMGQFKAGFLARTSHELRSPLNSLIGLHQLILSDLCDSPEEEREFIAQAQASALKLVKLLDEIIAVAKTQHGTNRLEIQPVQIANVFEQVYNFTYLQAANRSIPLEVSPPDPEIYVLADPRRLQQVVLNLVDSAIARMDGGSIRVSASPSPASDHLHIWIDVQGEGTSHPWSEPVDLLNTEKKTEEQVKNPDKQPVKEPLLSAGMNLLINQTLLEVMQGRLEVVAGQPADTPATSAPANTTRLQLSIPLVTPETT
ncbi:MULTISPECIES: sensor histidine kinase [Cyanophyceae]|uniref:sensor histidine kinase n=1 Tax=Cyanophyceae TaxID=3028117 RepID=UPI001683BD32|nr:HAMP domain-containing sensor histidine kinase [Trichocoleus sp. FACHB-40]MBD2003105.1 HAMP domain-containing histidine kinase [Trichocoleus sp. FACHB-40]